LKFWKAGASRRSTRCEGAPFWDPFSAPLVPAAYTVACPRLPTHYLWIYASAGAALSVCMVRFRLKSGRAGDVDTHREEKRGSCSRAA
jgi:hypothetical protein